MVSSSKNIRPMWSLNFVFELHSLSRVFPYHIKAATPSSIDHFYISITMHTNDGYKAYPLEFQPLEQDLLDDMGEFLVECSSRISQLEQTQLLAPAIQRMAEDLADAVLEIKQNLQQQSEEDREILARAFVQDSCLALQIEGPDSESKSNTMMTTTGSQAMSQLSQEEVVEALHGAESILSDVEVALRSIGKNDAEELAHTSLIVARIFVLSLQSIHKSFSRNQFENRNNAHSSAVIIEELSEETPSSYKSTLLERSSRTRMLWPPIGPAVKEALQWTSSTAQQHPILAIAVGLTLWPVAVLPSLLAPPLLCIDHMFQSSYNHFSNHSLIEKGEEGMYNLCQIGQFYLIVSKLALRQSQIITQRQIQRRGGLDQIAKDTSGFILQRIQHPIETVGMAVDGVGKGMGALLQLGGFVKDVMMGEEEIHVPLG